MLKSLWTVAVAGIGACAIACSQPASRSPVEPPDTRPAEEATLRGLIGDWAAAAQAKDVEKFVSAYADDAVMMFEDAPDVSGKAAIREALGGLMQDPNFSLTFGTTAVDVARSGDLAYEAGNYSLTMTDPTTKKAVNEKGNYIVVWKKQADGSWKVVRDVPVSDGPATPVP